MICLVHVFSLNIIRWRQTSLSSWLGACLGPKDSAISGASPKAYNTMRQASIQMLIILGWGLGSYETPRDTPGSLLANSMSGLEIPGDPSRVFCLAASSRGLKHHRQPLVITPGVLIAAHDPLLLVSQQGAGLVADYSRHKHGKESRFQHPQ